MRTHSIPKIAGRVLLIGRVDLFNETLLERLEQNGISTSLQTIPLEAVEELRRDHFHAVVADQELFNDWAELQVLQTLHASGMPVVVVVSQRRFEWIQLAVNFGASYILTTPLETLEILNALHRLWERPSGLIALLDRYLDLHELTLKEKEVARLVIKGLANKEIAGAEETSDRTVKAHLTHIFQKCHVTSRTELFNAIFPT